MKEAQRFSTTVGRDTITIETGKLAGQANGAVTVRLGDTIILTTATMAKQPREGVDFFPLSVEYEERLSRIAMAFCEPRSWTRVLSS